MATIKKKNPKLAIDGVSEVEQAKALVNTTKSPDMCIKSITIKLQRFQEWSATSVELDINGGGIEQKVHIHAYTCIKIRKNLKLYPDLSIAFYYILLHTFPIFIKHNLFCNCKIYCFIRFYPEKKYM